jgi:4'-phosphopantetheinyl transferase EntD
MTGLIAAHANSSQALRGNNLKSLAANHAKMTECTGRSLQRALDSLSLSGVLIGCRLISPGDEFALFEEEARSIASRSAAVRRRSGAARIVGRQLLARLGYPECAVAKGAAGAPIWPAGITGSFAHDDHVAVAVVGKCSDVGALGIDVEPAKVLPPELLQLVATPQERRNVCDDPYCGRLLFAAKEAVYKAVYPLDREFLDYHDIQIDLAGRKAGISNGRVIDLRFAMAAHLVAVALI